MSDLKQTLTGLPQAELEVKLKDLVRKVINQYKQELVGENDELLDRILRQFRGRISRVAWKASQKWCKWDSEGPILMPDYTRLYYRKGKTEVLVQEFPPQVRLTSFKGALVNRASTSEQISSEDMSSVHHFSLAFPYVVFVFKFVDGLFQQVKCAFCDRPLKRLNERPLRPYLSNLDTNLQVCLGTSFNRNKLEKDQVAQQAAYVLDHFWQSVYSDEWATHYWAAKRHFTENNDNRMKDLFAWQDASEENALFVVEDVNWLKHAEESFGDIIVRMFDDDRPNAELAQELYDEFTTEFMDELKNTITENLNSVAGRVSEMGMEQIQGHLLNEGS